MKRSNRCRVVEIIRRHDIVVLDAVAAHRASSSATNARLGDSSHARNCVCARAGVTCGA